MRIRINEPHTQPGHSRSVLHAFFDELGEQRCKLLEAVSADLAPAWQEVIRERAPNALVCADPFHVIKLAGEALDTLQRLRKHDPRRGGGGLAEGRPRALPPRG